MRQPAASTTRQQQGTACCSKVGLKRGPWTPEEDEALARYIRREGEGRWRTLPKRAGLLRCGKSCRLRWMNYLRPDVKRGHIAPDEEDLILRLHRLLGNRWSLIAGRIPGRTDNEIKNYWNTHLSKKLISQGIDPRTHKPLISNDNPTNPNPNPTPQPPPPPPPPPTPPNPNPNPEYSSYNVDQQPSLSVAGDIPLHFDQNSYFSAATLDGGGNQWRLSEGIATMNPQRSIRDIGYETGSVYFCAADDTYSSFLNSLISEDTFIQQYHQQQQQQDYHNLEFHQVALAQFDAPASSASGFEFGEWWEASSLSCPAALDQDIAGRLQDHIGKHF